MTNLLAPPGLKGLIVADTAIGMVRGDEGFYHYGPYDATELARTSRLEAVWSLLETGALPDAEAEADFTRRIGDLRAAAAVHRPVIEQLAGVITQPHLLLQAALPLIRPHAQPTLDIDADHRRADVHAVVAAAPVILATLFGDRRPDPSAGHAADWLRLVADTDDELSIAAMQRYLIATIDHGFNASTFATRVVTSTGTDVVSALSAGVGALAGPLHGGAPARALAMIEAIGEPDRAGDWVRARLADGDKIMGFGHAVYRAGDPRSALMRETAEAFAAAGRGVELVERAVAIEAAILAELRRAKPDAVIVTNVEYYAGVVLHLAGVPADAFTSCFTVSRLIGWGAHLLEQAANNKIMRPSARYVGPSPDRIPAPA